MTRNRTAAQTRQRCCLFDCREFKVLLRPSFPEASSFGRERVCMDTTSQREEAVGQPLKTLSSFSSQLTNYFKFTTFQFLYTINITIPQKRYPKTPAISDLNPGTSSALQIWCLLKDLLLLFFFFFKKTNIVLFLVHVRRTDWRNEVSTNFLMVYGLSGFEGFAYSYI